MDFKEIYTLNNAFRSGALHVQPIHELNTKIVFKGLEEIEEKPLKFKFHSGSTAFDLVGTTYSWIRLISYKVVDIFKQEGFTGWSTIPALIYNKKNEIIKDYYVIRVQGKCGPIDNSKSIEVVIPPKSPKGKPRKGLMGLYFNQETWDGLDIFSPEETGFIFVTEKVKQALEGSNVSNIHFKSVTDIENMKV